MQTRQAGWVHAARTARSIWACLNWAYFGVFCLLSCMHAFLNRKAMLCACYGAHTTVALPTILSLLFDFARRDLWVGSDKISEETCIHAIKGKKQANYGATTDWPKR
jgi:hypothetical protein